MGIAYKNFWSINVDEAVVTGIIKNFFKKDAEVFMPLNAQMKDVDLIIANLSNKKIATIQVKGSRAYEPTENETEKFGKGSTGWFFFKKEIITRSKSDYFIFLVYVIKRDDKKGRRHIEPHIITIPTKKLKELCRKNKKVHGGNRYSFYFWVNPIEKISIEWRDEDYSVSRYLDNRGLENIRKSLS